MTARPPFDAHDRLGPDERALAAYLAASPVAGPSAALDARILSAARASVATRATARRPAKRWPTAVGAMATLVIAVGLAWQLKPLIDIPAPLRQRPAAPAAEAEVLAQAEPLPQAPAPPAPTVESDAAAAPAQAAARLPGPPRPTRAVTRERAAAPTAAAHGDHDYLDEAVGDDPVSSNEKAAVPAPTAPPPVPVPEAQSRGRAEAATAPDAAAPASLFGPPAADAALPPEEWLMRIRARIATGDKAAARESLRRFMREYPHLRVPDDLRGLRAPPR